MLDLTDVQLLDQVTLRDQSAVCEIYRRHGGTVLSLANRLLGDRDVAEDVCEEVFLSLWEGTDRFAAQRGTLRANLLTRTHGRCVELIRARRDRCTREGRVVEDRSFLCPEVVDHHLDNRSEAQMVRSAVDSLPNEERVILQLAYFGAHTYRDIALLLNLPEGTVKTRIRSALKRLGSELEKQLFEVQHSDGVATSPAT